MWDESVGTDNTVTMTTPRYEEHSADRESPDTLGALRSAVDIGGRVFVFSRSTPKLAHSAVHIGDGKIVFVC